MNVMSAEAEKRMGACVELIGRTGAQDFQLRYSDDLEPTVWIAVAQWHRAGESYHLCAAGMNPLEAAFALCEQAIDGGECQHCHKASGVALGFDAMPLKGSVCWYQYDPEMVTFRRGCE